MPATLERSVEAKSERVLIVDNEGAFRVELANFLGKHGFDTKSASDGRSAMRLAEEFEPEVMLMDIQLTERQQGAAERRKIDGIDTAVAIQRRFPACRLYFITAYTDRLDYHRRSEASGLEVVEWIDRTVSLKHILERIKREDDIMDREAQIDDLYDQIRDLLVLSIEKPQKRAEVDALARRLQALEAREIAALERSLNKQRILKRGEGQDAIARLDKLLDA